MSVDINDKPKFVGHFRKIMDPERWQKLDELFHSALACEVELKVLHSELTDDSGRVQRFRQEARAVLALNHPHILTIFDIGEIDGRQFIATEFVEGQTLRDLINNGPLELSKVLDVATQIASALSAAHTAGIIHRDIKPE